MIITATEIGRLDNGRVLIQFTDDKGSNLLPGGRFYDVTDWDSDPQAIVAKFSAETKAALPNPIPIKTSVVSLDSAAIAAKLASLKA